MNMKRVTSAESADADTIIVTLFLCRLKRVRGWFVGPVSLLRAGVSVPYIAPSRNMLGEVAIVRARRMAEERGLAICIVDPDDLWTAMWSERR